MKLLTYGTTRGVPPCVLLEELGVDYELFNYDIGTTQRDPALLAVNPLGRVPVLIDGDRTLDQSSAILVYLAEKFDRFLPKNEPARSETFRYLMLTATDVVLEHVVIFRLLRRPHGPVTQDLLDLHRSRLLASLRICNRVLAEREFLAGEFSIADIHLYPIVGQYGNAFLVKYELPHLARWIASTRKRPAVQAAESKCPYRYEVTNTLA